MKRPGEIFQCDLCNPDDQSDETQEAIWLEDDGYQVLEPNIGIRKIHDNVKSATKDSRDREWNFKDSNPIFNDGFFENL